MNRLLHAALAKALIDDCGGLDAALEAVRLCDHRSKLARSQLHAYGNPNASLYMPADVIDCLQRFCGKRTYSDRIGAGVDVDGGDLKHDVDGVLLDSAALMGAVRDMLERHGARPITPRLQTLLQQLVAHVADDLAHVSADIQHLGG